MITSIVLLAAALVALAYGWRRSVLRYRNELAGAKRTADDRVSEKQRELDVAVTATFLRVRDDLSEKMPSPDLGPAFDALETLQTTPVQNLLTEFREKVAVLNAATIAAQNRVATASREVEAIRAENTLHRTLLERALSLPLDTPPATKELYHARAMALLTSERATHDCPNDEVWDLFVRKHAAMRAGESPLPNMNGAKA